MCGRNYVQIILAALYVIGKKRIKLNKTYNWSRFAFDATIKEISKQNDSEIKNSLDYLDWTKMLHLHSLQFLPKQIYQEKHIEFAKQGATGEIL